jgi:hypothetical protein
MDMDFAFAILWIMGGDKAISAPGNAVQEIRP